MTRRAQPAADPIRRRRARIVLLVLVFILGKGMPMPAMAAEHGNAMSMPATAAHCIETTSHSAHESDQAVQDSSAHSQGSHPNCCTSESGTCAQHCAMSLPMSILSIALEPALSIPGPTRLPSLVQRTLSPPQRPPKV